VVRVAHQDGRRRCTEAVGEAQGGRGSWMRWTKVAQAHGAGPMQPMTEAAEGMSGSRWMRQPSVQERERVRGQI
jgi:hypothetical protein